MMTALQRVTFEREFDLPVRRRRAGQKALAFTRENRTPAASDSVHPIVVAIPVLTAVWFLAVAWVAFAGGEGSLMLAVVTFITAIFFSLLVGGAAMAGNAAPESRQTRSLSAFLHDETEVATGRVSG